MIKSILSMKNFTSVAHGREGNGQDFHGTYDILLWICTHARNHLDYVYHNCSYQEELKFSKSDCSFLSLLVNIV